jgi:hypothetical protein
MRLAYGYLLLIAPWLVIVSYAFEKDEDLETVSIDWIHFKNKLLNVAKRCVILIRDIVDFCWEFIYFLLDFI